MIERPGNGPQQRPNGGGGNGGGRKSGSFLDSMSAGALLGGVGRGIEKVLLYTMEMGKDGVLTCLAIIFWLIAIVIVVLVGLDVSHWGTYRTRAYPEGRYVGGDWADVPIFALIALVVILLVWFGVKLKRAGTFSDNREKVERAISGPPNEKEQIVVLPQIEDKNGTGQTQIGDSI